MHPSTELRLLDPLVGFGVFATAQIARGTIVWALDPFDLVFEPERVEALPSPLRSAVEKGAYLDPAGHLIFCWDHGRHVNHSCEPNCRELGCSFEIAARTIEAGEEITCDYAAIGVLIPFDCRCGTASCRGRTEPGPPHLVGLDEDPDLYLLWKLAAAVPQPLLEYAAPAAAEVELLRTLRRRQARANARKDRTQRREQTRMRTQRDRRSRRNAHRFDPISTEESEP